MTKSELTPFTGTGNNAQLDAAAGITGSREEIIQSLLHIAETSSVNTGNTLLVKQLAMDCLGDYRAEKAVDFLVSNISFEEVFPRKRAIAAPEYVWGLPCARSLIQIGQPSIDGIFKRLQEPAKAKELAFFGFVIHEIDGEEVGLYRLQVALGKSQGIQKEQIQRVIDIYRQQGWSKREYLTNEPSPGSEPLK